MSRNNDANYSYSYEKTSEALKQTQTYLEQFNCPRTAIKFSSEVFPNNLKTIKGSKLPFSAIIQPCASVISPEAFPIVGYGPKQPLIRCMQCKAFLNPFSKFIENGEKYCCNICNTVNPTPQFFYCGLDKQGERPDKNDRAELCCGAYDLNAGDNFMERPPMPPTFIFLIDVSQEAVQTGMLDLTTKILSEVVENELFPGITRAQVALFAYDSALHYFLANPSRKNIQIITVPSPKDFDSVPFPDPLILNAVDNKGEILRIINSLPSLFANTKDRGSCLLSAISSVTKTIKSVGGRLFVLQAGSNITTEPELKLPAPLKSLSQKQIFSPTSSELSELSHKMQEDYISANFFIFSETYKNVVTLAELSKNTGGEIFYYPTANSRDLKFYNEFKNNITKETMWESLFRVRVSSGWKVTNKYGNYSVRCNDLLSIPSMDEHQSLIYEFELEEELAQSQILYIQTSLLHTTSNGARRLRILNYGIPLVERMSDVFSKADSQVVSLTLYRRSLAKISATQDPVSARNEMLQQAHGIVAEMCKECVVQKPGTYIDAFASFPLTLLGMVKHVVLSANGIGASKEMDLRNSLRVMLNAASLDQSMAMFTPYLFTLHSMVDENAGVYDEEGCFTFPQMLSLTSANLTSEGLYLMDDGMNLYMLIGSELDPRQLQEMFGVKRLSDAPTLTEDLLYDNYSKNQLPQRICNLIAELRARKPNKYATLLFIKEGERSPEEFEFYMRLIEDKLNHPLAYKASISEFSNRLHLTQ